MITEDILADAYIRRIIARDADRIYTTEAYLIRSNFTDSRAGRLASFLLTQPYTSVGSAGHQRFHFRILTHLRLLDILHSPRRQNGTTKRKPLALYNKVVWGILYNNTLPDIQYGFTKDIRDSIREQLQKAVQQ
ncbi:MAG: hypothetical protein LIP08_03005 [Bacteroides sp.]|nr:hypothetical protein [Bacteroides sp.]